METPQPNALLPYALLAVPARLAICRALLEAGEHGLPAAELAAIAGLTLPRATHCFRELLQADVVAVTVHGRQVSYVLKARHAVREALDYLGSSGLLS
ncbi:transcriptional regulator [Cupriavidus sp. USMAA2-4]|uniref:Transcriptional regulator n=1 Tax=Cupriavidus malaysiensis TaxID=367825 RepID=A0ABM6F294_9BURK|nr:MULTISPECIES: winged helix-turn-helix domain-containing protein [Cupriavidus]AOY91489.1 transcriptional regulator [Cupriavidus sp. USMAA2-4]AOY98965.1 transcriptional regulator [Cupriavidus sp. USMAHM13]AOZ05390.1 transcriptional regulator [Cupriavidus malaysiensis]